MSNKLVIAGKEFNSRLIIGTGKYTSFSVMKQAFEASGADMITVAIRRVNLNPKEGEETLLDYIDRKKYMILPNTAGAYNAEEAIRIALLAAEAGFSKWIKLEVLGDQKTLLPDTEALLKATKVLVKEGFIVLAYTNDDLIMARKLEDAGAAAVMPLASPIGSGQGILNPSNIILIKEALKVPVIVDAGVGTASDAAITMELGVDGILMNTAIAAAKDPVKMAEAMKLAVISGRLSLEAGRMPRRIYASASSPETGISK
jgi:thiazole synthase